MQDDAVALVKESSIDTFRSSETSIVYNNKGKDSKIKGRKRLLLPYLGQNTKGGKRCSNCYRGQKFYSHNGIDAKGIMRAVLALIKNNGEKTQGASTITQQLARGVFLSTEKDV